MSVGKFWVKVNVDGTAVGSSFSPTRPPGSGWHALSHYWAQRCFGRIHRFHFQVEGGHLKPSMKKPVRMSFSSLSVRVGDRVGVQVRGVVAGERVRVRMGAEVVNLADGERAYFVPSQAGIHVVQLADRRYFDASRYSGTASVIVDGVVKEPIVEDLERRG